MTTTYTLPKYPTYTQNSHLDTAINGIYKHEYTLRELMNLAKNLPDDVKLALVRDTAGMSGQALFCCRLAQERARQVVEESFMDDEDVEEVTLQGNPINRAKDVMPKDKALRLLMKANEDFIKQSDTMERLDVQALTMDAIVAKVRTVLTEAQWLAFQRDLDQRIVTALRSRR